MLKWHFSCLELNKINSSRWSHLILLHVFSRKTKVHCIFHGICTGQWGTEKDKAITWVTPRQWHWGGPTHHEFQYKLNVCCNFLKSFKSLRSNSGNPSQVCMYLIVLGQFLSFDQWTVVHKLLPLQETGWVQNRISWYYPSDFAVHLKLFQNKRDNQQALCLANWLQVVCPIQSVPCRHTCSK
jgi:hypothetical protein